MTEVSKGWRLPLIAALVAMTGAATVNAQTAQTPTPQAQSPAAVPSLRVPPANAAPLPKAPAPTAPVADIAGMWIDHTGRGAIEIAPCGQKLCGHIVWLQSTTDPKTGKTLVDLKNPDASKRKNPICGVQVIGNLVRTGTGKAGAIWGSGWIYNPEDGDTFDVEVQLLAPDRLQVMGYAGFKFLNETYTWRRAPADAQRCAPSRV
jgi:uncharacterized protein (DUF2147 family)